GPRVPGNNGVDARRGDETTFGVPGHAEDSTPDAAELLVAAELGAYLAVLRVPDLHESILAGRNNPLAIRTVGAERYAADFIVVFVEGPSFLAVLVSPERCSIPDADRTVGAGRSEAQTVRAERHARAPFGVSMQAEHLSAGLRVPDPHRLVFAARSDQPAVGAESDALDVSSMQVESAAKPAGCRIPQF